MAPRDGRLGRALGASAAIHFAFLLLAMVLMTTEATRAPIQTPALRTKFVYVASPGLAGGGGGNSQPAPPRPLEVPPHQRPAPVPIEALPLVVVEARPVPVLDARVETSAATVLHASGINLTAPPAPSGRSGTGAGSGAGPGVNAGRDGGSGGGPQQVGGDVIGPTLLKQVRPSYTSAAMLSKLQGTVVLEAVVRADGTVGEVRVIRSLDARLGLDQEAIKAARQWIFLPGTRRGQPVDVLVTLILEFRLH